MPGSWDPKAFPALVVGKTCTETSPADPSYNCIGWAADTTLWWQSGSPDYYWPDGVPDEWTMDALIKAYETIGYSECADASYEDGFEKIALYERATAKGTEPTHAARQLSATEWTSKLGDLEDISHTDLDACNGPSYGSAVRYLKRAKKP